MSTAPSVLFLAPSAQPLGGVQTWLEATAPALRTQGWDVQLLLTDGPCSDARRYLQLHPFPGARTVRATTGTREGRVRALRDAIAEANPAVVVNTHVADGADAVARLRGAAGSPRLVMALHALEPAHIGEMGRQQAVLDAVVSTSRLGARAAVALAGMPAQRVFQAACGVEVGDAPSPGEPGARLELVYCGRLDDREKRVMDLPRILAALAALGVPAHLTVAGSGPDEARLAQALAPFDARMEGALDAASLRERVYRPGRVLLVLSPRETGPLVAWEAMERGLVLVTADFLGRRCEGVLKDGENCLTFAVGDADGAARAIRELRDAALAQRLARAGRALVETRYSLDASLRDWDQALRAVLDLAPLAAAAPPAAPPSGRLDALFGASLAETIRGTLGRRFTHAEAGAEWPHAYAMADELDPRLRALDQEGDTP